MELKISDYITGKVIYDGNTQNFYISDRSRASLLASIKGWDEIVDLFADKLGYVDKIEMAKFQYQVGQFIADAINEKMERDKYIITK